MRLFVDLASGVRESRAVAEAAFWSSALTLQVPVALAQGRAAVIDLPQALGGRGAEAGMAGAEALPE
jgi:hypothetical protein